MRSVAPPLNITIGRRAYALSEPLGDGRVRFVAPDLDLE